MPRHAYYSLLLFPLALLCIIAAVIYQVLHGGSAAGPTIGLALLGFYCLFGQTIWAQLALSKRVTPGDAVFLVGIFAGLTAVFGLLLGHPTESGSLMLASGATVAPIMGFWGAHLVAACGELRRSLKKIAEFPS